jgi:predicted glycosyltransferase
MGKFYLIADGRIDICKYLIDFARIFISRETTQQQMIENTAIYVP